MPHDVPWAQARALARAVARPVPGRPTALADAVGAHLAHDAVARTALPPADVAAMDGWAVAGPAPWLVQGQVLAGTVPVGLAPGHACAIATGAQLPPGAHAVLRREHGALTAGRLTVADAHDAPAPGTDVRRAGTESAADEVVLTAGARLTPPALALLAAAGHDDVTVRRPRVQVLVVGDELLRHGPARDARVRDALGPLLQAWLPALGLQAPPARHVPDDLDALAAALTAAVHDADLVVTTGATARGPVDHVHGALAATGCQVVVDGVAVRPGHPQVLAVAPGGCPVVALPGNPLAAVGAVLTLVEPVAAGLSAAAPARERTLRLHADVPAGPHAVRLVPVRDGVPTAHAGPAMLRGLTSADAMAVVPPGGALAGCDVTALALPWT